MELHRRLKAQAKCEGISVSQVALREIRRSIEHLDAGVMPPAPDCPPLKEVLDELAAQPRRHLSPSPTEMLREDRDSR